MSGSLAAPEGNTSRLKASCDDVVPLTRAEVGQAFKIDNGRYDGVTSAMTRVEGPRVEVHIAGIDFSLKS